MVGGGEGGGSNWRVHIDKKGIHEYVGTGCKELATRMNKLEKIAT